ncbi:MAG: carbon storage regulator [Planctomycetia bacterium]|nr:carbon storage regulator [Planctomycetia bacterium]
MLVLSRRPDESLIINENIEVVVLGVTGNKVSLGIVAPSDVSVYRKELAKPKKKKKVTVAGPKKTWHVLSKIQQMNSMIR